MKLCDINETCSTNQKSNQHYFESLIEIRTSKSLSIIEDSQSVRSSSCSLVPESNTNSLQVRDDHQEFFSAYPSTLNVWLSQRLSCKVEVQQ